MSLKGWIWYQGENDMHGFLDKNACGAKVMMRRKPVCPLFWVLAHPKQGLFQSKQGVLWVTDTYIYLYIYTYIYMATVVQTLFFIFDHPKWTCQCSLWPILWCVSCPNFDPWPNRFSDLKSTEQIAALWRWYRFRVACVALFFASQGCRKVVEETRVQLAELAAIHYLTGTQQAHGGRMLTVATSFSR